MPNPINISIFTKFYFPLSRFIQNTVQIWFLLHTLIINSPTTAFRNADSGAAEKKEKHHIIGILVDRCADSDKRTRKFACFAVGNAAYHNDSLYDELRRAISQLKNLLLSSGEEDKTKANATGALSDLVRNSNPLCEDIVSRGVIQALLKVVADCSKVALNPWKERVTSKDRPAFTCKDVC